jgi:transcription initiation factor TFIID subunit TAF12
LRRGTGGGHFARNIGAGTKAGIGQAARRQPIQRCAIFSEMRGLAAWGFIPIKSQPVQIL